MKNLVFAIFVLTLATAASAQSPTDPVIAPIPQRAPTVPVPTEAGTLAVMAQSNSRLVPLHAWYSPSRGDNVASTDPAWRGAPGATHAPDYRWSGIEGYVLDPAIPPPPGTVPLYTWYSPSRNDHHLSADPALRPAADADRSRDPDYRLVRLEGYLYEAPLAGTFPLQNHYSPGRGDNHATTRAVMLGAVGDTTDPDYRLFRTEGYVVAPEHEGVRAYDAERLGIGRVRFDHKDNVPVRGSRPLLVIALEYADVPLRHTMGDIDNRFWRSDQSIDKYFRQLSRNRFHWTRVGVLGPYRPSDDPATPIDETLYNCFLSTEWDHDGNPATPDVPVCPGVTLPWEIRLADAVRMADRDFDFSRYDSNGDGSVDGQELGIAVVSAHPSLTTRDQSRFPSSAADSGATRYDDDYGGCIAADGVQVCGPISGSGESASPATVAHELLHELDSRSVYDLYGSGRGRSSLMGGTMEGVEDRDTRYLLDPWHTMRLGWADPVVRPIHPAVPPGAARLLVPSAEGRGIDPHPVVFFDPRRGYRESFLLEFRRPQSFDADVSSTGVALWYARTTPQLGIIELPREVPGANPTWHSSATGSSLWVVGASDGARGRSRFWAANNLEISPRWYAATPRAGAPITQGPESGLRFRVGNELTGDEDPQSIDVEWRTSDAPFLPRIDSVEVSGNSLVLRGEFGPALGAKHVWLEPVSGGGQRLLGDGVRWHSDAVRVRLPSPLRAGNYTLRACTDAARTQCGNAHELRIAVGSGLI